MPEITLDTVKECLRIDSFDHIESHLRMAPLPRGMSPDPNGTPPREAGVLALLVSEVDGLHVVLTRRQAHLRGHSGQISFPGGKRDPEDESFTDTALRETQEELGIMPDDVRVLGQLSAVYIPPSNFNVYPTVGYLPTTPYFRPNPDEVAEVFTLPLNDLIDEHLKQYEYRDFQGVRVKIPYYLVHGHKVWGATAVMLSELEHRLHLMLG
ncbi:MAG: CoA pyrophosphatase [Aggregatilineales bacterium]